MADEFTYCGHLVGTASIYANAPREAYSFLNHFYNTVFGMLGGYQNGGQSREVYMFSDSLIVTGDDFAGFVESMCGVYIALLGRSLLLRGGMVKGKLTFDPRKTRQNFQKMLPEDDALARASALEKSVKGARFVVESPIAHQLIGPMHEWLTLQGYIGNPASRTDMALERSISPLPNNGAFEILYPVHEKARTDDSTLRTIEGRMYYLMNASPADVGIHYSETIRLIKHSEERRSHIQPRLP